LDFLGEIKEIALNRPVKPAEPFQEYLKESRHHSKAIGYLEIWKLRKQKFPYKKIAADLGISEEKAKDRFYRAYELTQMEPYDPDKFRREKYVKKIDLKNHCDDCVDRESCKELCPAVMPFVDQDRPSKKEIFRYSKTP